VTAAARAGVPITLTVRLPAAALDAGARDSVSFVLSAANANGLNKTSAQIAHLILF
jgi:hypothetical protein